MQMLPEWMNGVAFTVAEGRMLGLTDGRMRNRALARPFHGMRVAREEDPGDASVATACAQLHTVLSADATFSHVTAARLWGMPLPSHVTDELHVMTRSTRGVRRPGVVGWVAAKPPPAVAVRRLPVLSPADTWVSLATMTRARGGRVSDEWLVAIGDFLVSGARARHGREPALATLDQLRAAVRRHGSRRGAARLALALELIRTPVDSPPETFVRLDLVAAGLPEPCVQPAVATAAGKRHPDLAYLEHRVLIEYLGDVHRTDAQTWRDDLVRVQLFEAAGYRVILAGADDITFEGRRRFAARVRRALRRAAPTHPAEKT